VGAFGQSDIMPRKEKRATDKEVSNCFHAAVKLQKENARLRSNFFYGIICNYSKSSSRHVTIPLANQTC